MTIDLILLNVLVPALVVVVGWLMPALTPRTVPFGVRIPPDHADHQVIARQRKLYRWWVALAGSVLVIASAVLAIFQPVLITAWPTLVVLLAVQIPGYLRARHVIRSAKQREGWYAGLRQAVAADTSLRTDPERFPWLWAIPALLLLVITVVVGILRYPAMPATLAEHYNIHGVADRIVTKSVGSAFAIVFIQAGITALILILTLLSFRSRPGLDAAAPKASARRHRVFAARMAKGLLVLAACVNLSMLVTAWQIWSGSGEPRLFLSELPVIAGVIVLVGVAVRTGQSGSRLPDGTDEDTGVVQSDDDRYWRAGGMFYVNRHDPALVVPKRFGVGWTINFGNLRGVLILLVPIAVIAAIPMLIH